MRHLFLVYVSILMFCIALGAVLIAFFSDKYPQFLSPMLKRLGRFLNFEELGVLRAVYILPVAVFVVLVALLFVI